MDVHRSRFVPYPTSAISALSFSRSTDDGYSGTRPALKLAVGRANGNIEIWNPLKGTWVQEAVFPGDGNSIDGLAWTHDPDETDRDGKIVPGQHRLFSIASSPAVTEWDLATGQVQRRSTGNFSEVWCLGAQPRWRPAKDVKDQEPQAQELVAGCGDGTLVLLSTADNDLQFKRFLARVSGKKARCMCITYQNRDIVVAGFADSIIRVYDTRNGSQIRQMSLGVGVPGAPKNALVWQVRALPNGDIASGDSNGEVRVWDGRNYSLLRRLTGHESDCLDLITSSDGQTIFSGSIDGRIAIYKHSDGRSNWAKLSHRRLHNGEVKAMASFDSKSGLSIVVSGGSDIAPVVTPLREYGKENVRALPTLPQEAPVVSAPRARLLASWWDKDVYIWRISPQSDLSADPEPSNPRKLVAKLSLTTSKETIRSVSITADGRLLAASTSSEIKVFQLKRRVGSDMLAVRKVDLAKDFAALGARLLDFSPNGKWLTAVAPDSEVHIARFTSDPEQPKKVICLPETVELDRHHRKPQYSSFKTYERIISRVAWSADSSVLAAGDLSGFIDSWVLEGHEDLTAAAIDKAKHDSDKGSSNAGSDSDSDSEDDDEMTIYYGQHWTESPNGHLLPKLESAPLVMTFRPHDMQASLVNGNPGVHSTRHNPHAHSHEMPTGQHRLWVMTARHQMYEFDVLAGKLTEWSRRNPTAVLPGEILRVKDRVLGAVWDATERLWLYGTSWLSMVDVSKDLSNSDSQLKKKRRRDDLEEDTPRKRVTNSGAGDAVKRSTNEDVKQYQNGKWLALKPKRQQNDEEDEDDELGMPLTRIESNGEDGESDKEVDSQSRARKWWLTFKYRPILGMVPLGNAGSSDPDSPLEVAIVERPLREARRVVTPVE